MIQKLFFSLLHPLLCLGNYSRKRQNLVACSMRKLQTGYRFVKVMKDAEGETEDLIRGKERPLARGELADQS